MKQKITINVRDKKVLVRTDYDVPLTIDNKIINDSRLRDSSTTIKWLIENGARVIICSSIGRPKNIENNKSVKHIIRPLSIILGVEVIFSDNCIGEQRDKLIRKLNKGQVLLLENVRFHKEEYNNDNDFSKLLSKNIDIYVNDAFGNSHRKHASMVGVPNLIKENALGFHMQRELYNIQQFLKSKESPKIGIVGGNKQEKIDAIANLKDKLDKIIVVGEIANYFLYAIYYNSPFKMDEAIYEKCLNIYNGIKPYNNFFLPIDSILSDNSQVRASAMSFSLPKNVSILDIGTETIKCINQLIKNSKIVIWNGPAGKYEDQNFYHGSISIVKSINNTSIKALVGGGDTLTVLRNEDIHNINIYTVSGGGALLTILKGEKLIAVESLSNRGDI
jgi:phosphoglycerate kinase